MISARRHREVEVSDLRSKLLIVEDDPAVRACLEQAFTDLGYNVVTAQDGLSALAAIRDQVPDILLTDLTMPGMSGFELLSVVSRRFPHIRAIAMRETFAGNNVPEGVAADAFYEKGNGMAALIRAVGAPAPGQNSRCDRPPRTSIQKSGQNASREDFVMMACSECFRTFPQAIGGTASMILDTSCIHCGCQILYAVAEPANPSTPKRTFRSPTSSEVLELMRFGRS
jgi:CheY-like chemotaxis protein